MTTTRPGILPREGLYIDPVISGLRKTILHPLLGLILLSLMLRGRLSVVAPYERLVQITAATSAFLWLNDWLNAKCLNNWTTDGKWDWKKELVVVTGGSGGIGAGVAQRLAAMGARVVVVDIIPLTFTPGIAKTLYLQRTLPFCLYLLTLERKRSYLVPQMRLEQ